MKTTIDLTSSQEEINRIIAIARTFGGVDEVSEATALDASKALNAGLTPDMVEYALSFITVVFTTGTAALEFLKALREQSKSGEAVVTVSEPSTGKVLGRIKADTADETLKSIIAP